MGALTPSFLFDLESNMRTIVSQDYDRLLSNLWYTTVAKEIGSAAKKEQISWLLDTAQIRPTGHGGHIQFDDMVAMTTSVENLNASGGLRVTKEKLDDLDANGKPGGEGIRLASNWARQMSQYAAYWPQKMVANAIRANPTTYDGKAFFATDHPVNPYLVPSPTFTNLFTAGSGPGALPIDTSVSVDVAVANVAKAIAYIAAIKMPNGVDPRFLRVGSIIVPPALTARAQQITNAKFIAQAATSGGGSGDVEAVIRNFGLGQPVEAPELAAGYVGGSDTTWYIGAQDILSSELGAFCYVNREPFSVLFYGPQTDAQLARIREFQWTTEGRNAILPGHPYLLFKCLAA
jgi:phage major head subunit gpT-like protein